MMRVNHVAEPSRRQSHRAPVAGKPLQLGGTDVVKTSFAFSICFHLEL